MPLITIHNRNIICTGCGHFITVPMYRRYVKAILRFNRKHLPNCPAKHENYKTYRERQR